MPGWLGDSCDERLSGAAATTTSTTAGRARGARISVEGRTSGGVAFEVRHIRGSLMTRLSSAPRVRAAFDLPILGFSAAATLDSTDVKVTQSSSQSRVRQVRILLWVLVALAIVGTVALVALRRGQTNAPQMNAAPVHARLGGPFTLVGGDGKPFSSEALSGKPYAIYFGFTRCGDVCPTTLSRLVRLRRDAANDQALNIVFVTIDPANDGPKEVGQYATLFNAPIIGLTGSAAQIEQVKKQYGIFAQPSMHPMAGKEMEHTATVLLFGRDGKFVGTIAPDEPDGPALEKLKRITV